MADPVSAIIDASTAEPSENALAIMRLSLVDWLSVGLAGADEPVSRIVRQLTDSEGGAPQAALFGGGRAPMRAAALLNGTTSHALDYDDTHFAHIGHPSVAVIPAALAVAENNGATLDQFLRAALAGCEASIRFGILFGRTHYQIGYHQTATAGAFGATLASVLQLTPDMTAVHHALGLVSTRASGLKSQFGTMGKPFNAGLAASNGVEAAQLATAGFVSNPDAITGSNGFLQTHHADGSADQPPGFLMESVSHKFHACCHGLHAALEALTETTPVDPKSVTKITVTTHPRWLTVCHQSTPTTGLGLKFSYRAILAAALLGHDTSALQTFNDALPNDAELIALRNMVTVIPDDTLSEMQAHVTLRTSDGEHTAFHDLDAALPLDIKSAKIRAKSIALLGQDKADRIWEVVHTKNATPVSEVAQLLSL
jgi:2-methylcitrate dehydratase PrpD